MVSGDMTKKKRTIQPQPQTPVQDAGIEAAAPLPPAARSGHQPSAISHPQLTVEAGLYAVLLALALVVRLYRLGLAPLSPSEAQLAQAAWQGALPPAGVSPLLTWLNAILFALFQSSDAMARLVPALVGSALIVLPAFLRERIGRIGALFAAAMLAISPVAIMASRTASGDIIAAAVMLGLVVAADRYLREGRTGWLYAGAVLLGVGLASERAIYSALIALAISAGVLAAIAPQQARDRWQAVRSTPGLPRRWLAVLVAVFLVSATALAWQMGGLGRTTDLLSAWLSDFARPAGVMGWQWPLQVLAVYEPLIVVAGIVGLFFALQRSSRFGFLLIAWLAVALILALVRSGRANGDTLLVVIPLALLAGHAFQAVADSLRSAPFGVQEAVLIAILLPVLAYLALGIAMYINNPNAVATSAVGQDLGPMAQVISSFLAIALAVILVAMFAAISSTESAVRGATIAILAALAMVTWSAGWGAAQVRPGDPREIILGTETTSLDVRDLTDDLAKLSVDKTADVSALPVTVLSAPEGVLGWYLRGMPNAHFAGTVDLLSNPLAVISTAQPPTLAGSYAGQRFTLQHQWRIEGKSAIDILRWLVYRRAEPPQPTREVVLWVRQGP